MACVDPYFDPCRVTARQCRVWCARDPLEIGKCGEKEEGITPSGESEGVWGQEEAGTELDQRPMRTCKYSELTFKHK